MGGTSPPKANPDVEVPEAAKSILATLKFATSAQDAPLHSSVFAVAPGVFPPIQRADGCVPFPAIFALA